MNPFEHDDDVESASSLPPDQAATISLRTFGQVHTILRLAGSPVYPDIVVTSLIPLVVIAYMIGGYYVILAPGNLYNALVSEDWEMFRTTITRFALLATVLIILKVVRGILRESSANWLRFRLTHRLHQLYLGSGDVESGYRSPSYYTLVSQHRIDNPDQRIVADAREFSSMLFNILSGGGAQGADSGGVIEAIASVLFYTRQTYVRTGWFGIGAAYLWTAIVSTFSVLVINRTSPVLFTQERLEADFRYAHTHLRRHAEEVAFLRGGPFERRALDERLRKAVSNRWSVIARHASLNGLQYGFGYYISLVMYITLSIAIQARVFDEGLGFPVGGTAGEKAQWISQTGGVFMQLLYSFTMLVQLSTDVSSFIANIGRLHSLTIELDACHNGFVDGKVMRENGVAQPDDIHAPLIGTDASHGVSTHASAARSDMIAAHQLRPAVPDVDGDGEVSSPTATAERFRDVSLELRLGESLALCGTSGCGKTSVLRVLRGLWGASCGDVRLPAADMDVMFSPQAAYIPVGEHTLREIVVYPRMCRYDAREAAGVADALAAVGWRQWGGGLGSKLDEVDVDMRRDWGRRLSPGEAQLVAASRVLYRRPVFAVMDEPTAAMDRRSEDRVLRAVKEAGISLLVVGHSESVRSLHQQTVWMDGEEGTEEPS